MDFELSFGGVPLVIDTGYYQDWQSLYNRLEEERLTLDGYSYPGPGLLGITRPFHYPGRPKLKPGTYYYPAGASRWSEGIFLITQTQYDQIAPLAVPDGFPVPLDFVLQQGVNVITTPLYLLQCRPLAKFGNFPGLYLLQLVDERYFWAYSNADSPNTSSWAGLIADLTSDLNISLSLPAISDVYGDPHPLGDWQTSGAQNAAVMLDAALFNVGLRLVRNFDATYQVMTTEDSNVIAEVQRGTIVLSGGSFTDELLSNGNPNLTIGSILPEAVQTQFQQVTCDGETINPQTDHLPYSRNLGDITTVLNTISDVGFTEYGGFPFTLTFRDLAEAYYDQDGNLLNQDQINALALQLAEDFYDSQVDGLDELYPSIYPWQPEGLHDLTWTWAKDRCQTRVQRLPVNIWTEADFLHHFPPPPCSSSSSSSSESEGSESSGSEGSESSGSGSGPGMPCQDVVIGLTVDSTGNIILTMGQVPGCPTGQVPYIIEAQTPFCLCPTSSSSGSGGGGSDSGGGGGSGSGSGVPSTCCSGTVPNNLTLTIWGCTACAGNTVPLAYDGTQWSAHGGFLGSCGPLQGSDINLQCSGDTWTLYSFGNDYSPDTSNCDPLELEFSSVFFNGTHCCSGQSCTVTITM